jgi:uncharacterized protein YneF (UPF0154 family)
VIVFAADASSSSTPLWLGILTLVISFMAVLVSVWIGRAQIGEQLRMRPHVSMSCTYCTHVYSAAGDHKSIMVDVSNAGGQATDVGSIIVTAPQMTLNGGNLLLDGPGPIPYRLDAHSTASWVVDARMFGPTEAVVKVSLGHGVVLTEAITLDRLIDEDAGKRAWLRRR